MCFIDPYLQQSAGPRPPGQRILFVDVSRRPGPCFLSRFAAQIVSYIIEFWYYVTTGLKLFTCVITVLLIFICSVCYHSQIMSTS